MCEKKDPSHQDAKGPEVGLTGIKSIRKNHNSPKAAWGASKKLLEPQCSKSLSNELCETY